MLLGAVALVLYMDTRAIKLFMVAGRMSETFGTGARAFFFVMMALDLILALWFFIYIARFQAPFRAVLRNSLLMMLRHLPTTILAVVIILVSGFLVYLFMPSVVGVLLLVALPPLAALLLTFPFEKVFRKYMSEEDKLREDKLNGKEYL